jgi:hypothetical protein
MEKRLSLGDSPRVERVRAERSEAVEEGNWLVKAAERL